jgi:hypothetical protein
MPIAAAHRDRAREVSRILAEGRRRRARARAEAASPVAGGPVDYLHAVLPSGAWAGRRCFILGGGPSLRGFDFSRLRGELVIGVNRAFEAYDPCLLYSLDTRFLAWLIEGRYGAEAAERFAGMRATPVWCRERPSYGFSGGIRTVDCNHTDRLPRALEDGLPQHNNSGFGALCLALCLGCTEVYLLGFDMHGEGGRQAWWHDGHPIVNDDGCYAAFIRQFEAHAGEIAARGVRVVNLNPDSALRCFEFGRIEDIPAGPERPLVVAYATRGTGYEAEAEDMVRSAHRMGLDVDLRLVDTRGGWQANTQYKAEYLREMVHAHQGRAIVYTDADSRFVRYPGLFDEPLEGIAFHKHKGAEVLSGTLHIACNKATARLMDGWVKECRKQPGIWDQLALQYAVARWKGEVRELPKEYCCIFDHEPRPAAPVVVHYQASRRLKAEVGT